MRRVKNQPVEPTTTFFWATQQDSPNNPGGNGRTFDCSCEGKPKPGAPVTIGLFSHNIKTCEKDGKGFNIRVRSGQYHLSPKN